MDRGLTQTTVSAGQLAFASASVAYWSLPAGTAAAGARATTGTPRHSATNTRLVLPLAWMEALFAAHSSLHCLTLFCCAVAGWDKPTSPANAAHAITAVKVGFITHLSGKVSPSALTQRRRRERTAAPEAANHDPQPLTGSVDHVLFLFFPCQDKTGTTSRTAAPGAPPSFVVIPEDRALMRGENRGIRLHRRLRGDRGLGRLGLLLVPLDRLGLLHERACQHLVHARHRNDVEALLDAVADLHEVLRVLLGDQHRLHAAARRRQQLLLQAADRQHAAAQRDLAGHGDVAVDGNAGHHRHDGGHHGDAGRRAVLRRGALRHVHVDVLLVEPRRLDAEGDRAHAHVGGRRRDRFLHHVAQVAGDRHLALAGHHGGLDGEQLAADVGPGQAGDHADLVLVLDLAVAVLRHAEVVGDGLGLDRDRLLLRQRELLHRLADQVGELALEVAHARFPRIAADQEQQRLVVDRPLLGVEAVLGDRVRDQMLARNLYLLVLGVAGDADDLHAIHQGRRDVERVRRRDEHHVGEIVVDLQVVVVEGVVLLGIEHLEQRRGRIAAEIGAHLVDLVEQEQRIRRLRLAHRLDDLAGHRADIGAPVAADFGLVTHAAERHAHEVAAGSAGDRLAERGLADAGRADQAQDRAGELVGALLDREILDDAFLDLFQAEVIVVEDLLGEREVLLDLGLLVPGDREQPVEIVAHDRRLGRHRRHLAQLLELVGGLLARLLRELGLLDLVLDLGELVLAFLVAELLLDRLHLLIEVVLALGLLHLALDARADALLDLQHGDFALHQAEHLFETLGDRRRLQDELLVGNLDRKMRSHGVRELGIVLDLLDHADHLGRHLLVQLDVVLELVDDRAREGLRLDLLAAGIREHHRSRLIVFGARGIAFDLGTRGALDQHLDGAVGQLEHLQHARERTDLVDSGGRRIVVGGVLLRGQQDEGVGAHHLLERLDRLLAPNEERNDHVREDDDVAQRQYRIGPGFAGDERWLRLRAGAGHGPLVLVVVPLAPGPRMRRHGRVQRWAGKGNAAGPKELLGGAAARRRVGTKPSPEHVDMITSYACSSPTIGGDGACRCQVNPKIQRNSGLVMAARAGRGRIGRATCAFWLRAHLGARFARPVGAVGVDVEWPRGALDYLFRDHDLFDAFEARQVEHGIEQDALHDRAQSACPGLAVDGLAGDGAERLFRQGQIDRLHLEQPLVLLHQRVLGLGENELERGLVEVLERGDHRQPADEFRDQPILQEVLGLDLAENLAGLAILRRHHLGAEPDRGRAAARGNDLLEPRKGAAAHE